MMRLQIPPQAVYAVAGLAVLAFVYWKGRKALAAAGAAVNPVNPNNVFYSSTNALGSALGGTEDFSLGAKVYDWTHPDEPFTR